MNGCFDRTGGGLAEQHAPIIRAMGRELWMAAHFADVIGERLRPASLQNIVGDLLKRLASPTDGYADLTGIEQRVVILRIADPDTVVQRKPHRIERLAQAGRLVDPLRQHHHAAAVEDEHQRQLQFSDRLQDLRRRRGIGFDHAIAECELTPRSQSSAQQLARRWTPQHACPPIREREHSAVFCHDRVEQVLLGQHAAQIGQNATGHEHDRDLGARASRMASTTSGCARPWRAIVPS